MYKKILANENTVKAHRDLEWTMCMLYPMLFWQMKTGRTLRPAYGIAPPKMKDPERPNEEPPVRHDVFFVKELDKNVVYLGDWGFTILMPPRSNYILYTDTASICPLITGQLVGPLGKKYLLLSHIHGNSQIDTIDSQISNVLDHLRQRRLRPNKLFFSPSEESHYVFSRELLHEYGNGTYGQLIRSRDSLAFMVVTEHGFCMFDRDDNFILTQLWSERTYRVRPFRMKLGHPLDLWL